MGFCNDFGKLCFEEGQEASLRSICTSTIQSSPAKIPAFSFACGSSGKEHFRLRQGAMADSDGGQVAEGGLNRPPLFKVLSRPRRGSTLI